MQEEVVNAALVTVQQIAASPRGRESLAISSSIPSSVADRAIGTSGGIWYLTGSLTFEKIEFGLQYQK